ncbi:MAG: hypothetical protein EZS28_034447, partial [Streblomastix strix]
TRGTRVRYGQEYLSLHGRTKFSGSDNQSQ